MIIAGSTLGTPDRDLAEALRLFRTAGLDAAEVIYQDDYPAAISPSDPRSAQQAAAIADAEGVPIVALTPYTTSINSVDAASWQQGIDEFRCVPRAAHTVGATRGAAAPWCSWTGRARPGLRPYEPSSASGPGQRVPPGANLMRDPFRGCATRPGGSPPGRRLCKLHDHSPGEIGC
jgi:sugar phosphate isomerase/epimerase